MTHALLAVVILLGMWNTIDGCIPTIAGEHDHREAVSIGHRSFLAFCNDVTGRDAVGTR